MSNSVTNLCPPKILAETIVKGMQELKGSDITVLNLADVPGAVSQYFVICHGDSSTQVEAIARSIEKETQKEVNNRK